LRQGIALVTFKCIFEARDCGKGLAWSLLSAVLSFEARECGKGLGWSFLSAFLKRGIAAWDWAGNLSAVLKHGIAARDWAGHC
jgi:hypothetical protein